MNWLRVPLFTLLVLVGFTLPARSENDKDYPLGYDADKSSYFDRINTFDNSIQLSVDAGWALYSSPLLVPESYRSTGDFDPTTRQVFIGVMGEKNFFKAYSSLSVGISYMMLSTDMFGWPVSQGSGYVVIRNNEEALSYALAKNVSTSTSYISIPVEAKYELVCEENFGLYFKGAFRAALNFSTRTYFEALPEASAETKTLLEDFFKNDNLMFANANAYIGMRWGSYDATNFRLELGMPIALTRKVANLNVTQGFGVRFAFSLPLSIFYR